MQLYVIQYEGLDNKKNDDHRTSSVYQRDCGMAPTRILDEPNRGELIEFLTHTNFNDDTILHFISHGSAKNGIVQRLPRSNSGDKSSLITWQELAIHLHRIAGTCPHLFANLGTVCNSIEIMPFLQRRDFTLLVTNKSVSDPVQPKKNKS